MEKKELQTSNTDEMVTISRAEYEALKSLEAKAESLEAETEKLKDELRESEQKLAAACLKNDQLKTAQKTEVPKIMQKPIITQL